mgnify:CR=1 FL=1
MKKMTKVISLALALVMCLALCACGSKKEASYKMLDEKVSTEQYGIGFKKGNTELRDAVQAALFQLYKDGKVEEIAKKYSDYNLDAMLCLDKQTETTFDAAQASDEFKARTTFTVGFDAEYPPYGYMGADGEYTGFDLDLAQAVCDIYNWELVKTPIDWDTKDVILSAGQIDCIWNGMTLTAEVTSTMECSNAYCNNAQVVIVPADKASEYQTVESVKDLTFAAEAGSAGEAELTALGYTVTPVKAQSDALMEVAAGTSDAAVIDSLMAAAMVGEGTGYASLTYTCGLNSEEYGVGFRKGSDLAQKLNDFFKASYADGSMMQIAETYGVQAAIIEQK